MKDVLKLIGLCAFMLAVVVGGVVLVVAYYAAVVYAFVWVVNAVPVVFWLGLFGLVVGLAFARSLSRRRSR
jgi:hypothetical protein